MDGSCSSKRNLRLSDMHDLICQEVISNLPIKEAVRTSILSKKWENIWKGVTKLKLEEYAYEERQQFKDLVEKVLSVCNLSCLRNFTLIFEVDEDVAQFKDWLSRFIHPKIEEVTLDLGTPEQQFFFPEHMFTSEKLTKFELRVQNLIQFPSSIHFPSLKILTLAYVIFPPSSSTRNFFSGCPSLQELTLTECNWMNVKDVTITSPLLQKLVIEEYLDDEDEDTNAQRHCKIVINVGSKLKFFKYNGEYINDYFLLSHSTTVVNASIMVHQDGNNWEAGYFVLRLLRAFTNAKKLSLTDFAVEALSRTLFSFVHIPLFQNLAELNVVSPIDLSSEALQAIIRNSHCLEVLEFFMGVSLPENCANHMFPLPCCFRTHLKTIKIYYFMASKAEINAIKFLLQAASVLENLSVHINTEHDFESPTGVDTLVRIYKQIRRYPRASKTCKLKLE